MQAVERLLALDRDGKLQSPEARAMMSGELADMKLPTLGPLAKPDAVAAAENGAAVRSPATSAFPWDIYFFLKPAGGGWTIEAVRTLALPQFIHELRDELRAETHRNAEQDRLLRNFELTFKTDAELRLWFGAHRGDLDAMRGLTGLAAEAAASPPPTPPEPGPVARSAAELDAAFNARAVAMFNATLAQAPAEIRELLASFSQDELWALVNRCWPGEDEVGPALPQGP